MTPAVVDPDQATTPSGKIIAARTTPAMEMRDYEEALLHRDFSGNPAALEEFLCSDFEEISATGHLSSRQAVLDWLLRKDPGARWQLGDLSVTQLAPGLRLVRYEARQILPQPSAGKGARHSSLWCFDQSLQRWQLRFHQASKIA